MGLFSKDIKNMNDLFLHTLQDIYYAENQIVKALPDMVEKSSDPQLKQGFQTHLRETENHVKRLEQVFKLIGQKAQGVDCPAIDGIIEEANDVAGEVEKKSVLDAALIAAAQAVEHYEMTRYGTLISWAKELGRNDCVTLLQQTLDEEKATDKKLTAMAESQVNRIAEASVKKRHHIGFALPDLRQRALFGRLVGAPTQKPCAMAKALAAEMIVADFDHELRPQRLPFARTFGRPAAGAARRIAGEAGRADQRHQLFGERRLILVLDRRGEADMMQQAAGIVESQQERADDTSALVVAETADDAVGAAVILDLLHAGPVAGPISEIAPLGDDAVKHFARPPQPSLGFRKLGGHRR
jgi:ferritin-like metal-binding protein YciE